MSSYKCLRLHIFIPPGLSARYGLNEFVLLKFKCGSSVGSSCKNELAKIATERSTQKLQYCRADTQDPLNLCWIISALLKSDTRQLGESIGQPDFFYFKKACAIA